LNALQAKLPKELELLPEEQDGPGGEQAGVIFHPVRAAAITGKDVGDASVKMDQQMGRPYVALTFTPQGAKTFEELTGRIVGRKLAIALDGRVLSAPVVMSAIRGGKAQITLGGWSGPREQRAQADAIAVALTAGALPSTLVVEEERVVPAR
jgi:preprotein translocase subunit SecD